jgi:transcriptional antiterminator RfaH
MVLRDTATANVAIPERLGTGTSGVWDSYVRGASVVEPPRERAWYCLRALPKHEHIAAAHLRQDPEVEVFMPRIRYKRTTRFGTAWVNEALFLNYLFARFDLPACLARVRHARGVRGVVRFGDQWPTIAEQVMDELRLAVGKDEIRTIEPGYHPGDAVEIITGPFAGLAAVVTRVMPGPQRVAVLLEFLGRQTPVELDGSQLAFRDDQHNPRVLAWEPA